MAPLQRALALEHVNDVAVMVGDDLELDVARALDQALEVERRVAERGRAPRVWPARPRAGSASAAVTTFMPMPPPPADGFRRTGNPMRPAAASSAASL